MVSAISGEPLEVVWSVPASMPEAQMRRMAKALWDIYEVDIEAAPGAVPDEVFDPVDA
jgi:hypothetical protein